MADVIDSVVVTSFGTSWPKASIEKLREVYENHEDALPENCFLYDVLDNEDEDADEDVCTMCSTENDYDAKFCKECGTRMHTAEAQVVLTSLEWSGDDAAETFVTIFINKIVPLINGRLTGCVFYGDPDEEAVPWKDAPFVIEDNEITFVLPNMERVTSPPTFSSDDE